MGSTRPTGEKTVVCVLGTPRSGTSLTMRVLNLAGLYVGQESELYPPGPGNPTGYWENARAAEVNHRILRALGYTNADAPTLEPGWENSPDLEAEREEARALIADAYGGHDAWGWKDPRASVLLPFWQRLLPPMRYVICLRNPADMAASAVRFAAERGVELAVSTCFALWECYVTRAIVNTSGHPRMFVDYDEYFGDWQGVANRLASFAGLPPVDETPGEEIRELVDHRLRHHHSAGEDMPRDEEVPPKVRELYARLRSFMTSNAPPSDCTPNRATQLELDELAHSR